MFKKFIMQSLKFIIYKVVKNIKYINKYYVQSLLYIK